MATKGKRPDDERPGSLEGSIRPPRVRGDHVELKVTLRNPGDRPVHYVSDIRAMTIDPITGRLSVRLSEAGLATPPAGIMMLPKFRTIDPRSQATLTLRLPPTIVKFGPATPSGELTFEERDVAAATAIDLEVGWSDTPFYPDVRDQSKDINPLEAWERGRLRVAHEEPRAKA